MKHTILTIRDGQCRFPVTDDSPFLFCGEVTALDRVYCDHHHERCHAGYGKSITLLEQMIYSVENTVSRRRSNDETPNTQAVDVVVRG